MTLRRLKLLIGTARHMRSKQFTWRVIRKFYKPQPNLGPHPEQRVSTGTWARPSSRESIMIDATTLLILNEVKKIDKPEDWFFKSDAVVNNYNLHYFDDLNMDDWEARREWHRNLILRWIAEVPPTKGLAWDPYPVSLRMVNWIKWILAGNEPPPGMIQSLAINARHSKNTIEWQLLANHLLTNGKSLLFAGAFFGGEEGNTWAQLGFEIVAGEMIEEMLADGGHFERSVMYHSIVIEDVLDCINIVRTYSSAFTEAQRATAEGWKEIAVRMLNYLACLIHPDGKVVQFNDAGLGIAPLFPSLNGYAERLGLSSTNLPGDGIQEQKASRFFRLAKGDLALFGDFGSPGPSYQPAHCHAENLTFEASLRGKRLFVTTGTSTYAVCERRDLERSTAAHNTVEVDGINSSETWASFRVAFRAKALPTLTSQAGNSWSVKGGHEGYLRLPGKVTHSREFQASDGKLSILDELTGSFTEAKALYHFSPEVQIKKVGDRFVGELGGSEFQFEIKGASQLALETYLYSPDFGILQESQRIVATFKGPGIDAALTW